MATSSVSPYIPVYHTTEVNFRTPTSSGTANVHWTSAGSPYLPTILLLHGFPSSSKQYHDFMPLLASEYHVLAPDMPGFGLTTVPADFTYTFSNLAAVISAWLASLELPNYAMYIFDYGAPVGLRIALDQPTKISAIVSQNGNAYIQGFGQDFWKPVFDLWNSSNSPSARMTLAAGFFTLDATKSQYTIGTPSHNLPLVNPQSWTTDYLQNLAGDSNVQHQLDLFYDYRTNVEMYPAFQKYFRESQVPILAVWGKGDPAFIPPGAEAFKTDSPNAVVRFVDAGHFALESQRWEIARLVKSWLTNQVGF